MKVREIMTSNVECIAERKAGYYDRRRREHNYWRASLNKRVSKKILSPPTANHIASSKKTVT